jgi:ribosomal-protein-alanine acetyltransferase
MRALFRRSVVGRQNLKVTRRCRAHSHRITTRVGTLDDIQDIADLESHGSWSDQQVHDELTRDISRVLVAEKTLLTAEKTLVGWISAWRIPPFELQIIQVTVSQDYRRQGIGHQLLVDMLGLCDCEQVVLEVREDNIPAIELYHKVGFVTCGERKGYYKDGTSAYLMKKEMV